MLLQVVEDTATAANQSAAKGAGPAYGTSSHRGPRFPDPPWGGFAEKKNVNRPNSENLRPSY